MGEICKSGSMSGEGKRDDAAWPPVTAPFFDSTAGLEPGTAWAKSHGTVVRCVTAQAILPTLTLGPFN